MTSLLALRDAAGALGTASIARAGGHAPLELLNITQFPLIQTDS